MPPIGTSVAASTITRAPPCSTIGRGERRVEAVGEHEPRPDLVVDERR